MRKWNRACAGHVRCILSTSKEHLCVVVARQIGVVSLPGRQMDAIQRRGARSSVDEKNRPNLSPL